MLMFSPGVESERGLFSVGGEFLRRRVLIRSAIDLGKRRICVVTFSYTYINSCMYHSWTGCEPLKAICLLSGLWLDEYSGEQRSNAKKHVSIKRCGCSTFAVLIAWRPRKNRVERMPSISFQRVVDGLGRRLRCLPPTRGAHLYTLPAYG